MRIIRNFLLACLVVAALTSARAQAPNTKTASSENGRWVVVPATANPLVNQGTPYMFAWRLDTKTGDLEMCTYDPGGWTRAVSKKPETLNCSPVTRATNDPLGIR